MLPRPVSITTTSGALELSSESVVVARAESSMVDRVARQLRAETRWPWPIVATPHPPVGAVVVAADDSLAPEAYGLDVRPDGCLLVASGVQGAQHAATTLRLLLPASGTARSPDRLRITCVSVRDAPRFGWRGAHLDVARHLLPVAWILRFIDVLALHKINVLHLHLTDDQGWRIEITRYPRLTEVGSIRPRTMAGHYRENRYDDRPYGGFYTQQELREIAAHAAERGITVVPEIDMPGHCAAAIAAYPELGNGITPPAVSSTWGVSEDVLNVDPGTVRFMTDVLDEVADVFPGEYLHIGGDECPTAQWEASPPAMAAMRARGLESPLALQGWFTDQIRAHVRGLGRRLVAWDEAADAGAPTDTVLTAWRSREHGLRAAARGYPVIMAPEEYLYFDLPESDDPAEPVTRTGADRVISLERVHAFDPCPADVDRAVCDRILGAQCQLWTEYVPDTDKAEYLLFPRLTAFADVAWAPDRGSFDQFRAGLPRMLQAAAALGMRSRTAPGTLS